MYLLEFDRTRRVDKNYDKFRRYDCFLNYWWRYTDFGGLDDAPWVIFICQDRDHALQFLDAADRELTGDVSRPWSDDDYVGRPPDRGLPRAQRLRGQSRTPGWFPRARAGSGATRRASDARPAHGFPAAGPRRNARQHDDSSGASGSVRPTWPTR